MTLIIRSRSLRNYAIVIINDHNPLYTTLTDKLAVRRYVRDKTDKVSIIPLYGLYYRAKDIIFHELPNKYVLKCNHDSGSAVIVNGENSIDIESVVLRLDLALKKNMYYTTREWQYKNIKPVILCEKYIDLFSGRDKCVTPEMLRIHCFNGVACFVEADFSDASGSEYINIYDRKWKLLPFKMERPNTLIEIPEPDMFYKALSAAQEISKSLDYCRVDLMLLPDGVYFSEITLTPHRGKMKITPQDWDLRLGEIWKQ